MIPPEASASRGNLQRDVQSRPRFATLTCPNCLGTLQVQADTPAEAPCPICEHPLRYVPPEPAGPPAFVPRQRIEPDTRTGPRPAPARSVSPPDSPPAPPRTARTLRTLLREADDYLNTPVGTALAWALVAILLTASVILFVHWDHGRRDQARQLEEIESRRPAASYHPSTSPVPLLPGEPAPVDPFKLEE